MSWDTGTATSHRLHVRVVIDVLLLCGRGLERGRCVVTHAKKQQRMAPNASPLAGDPHIHRRRASAIRLMRCQQSPKLAKYSTSGRRAAHVAPRQMRLHPDALAAANTRKPFAESTWWRAKR